MWYSLRPDPAEMGAVRGRGTLTWALLGLVVVGLVGCGRADIVGSPPDASNTPYAGPLHLPSGQRTGESEQVAGAAGRVVQCTTKVSGGVGRDPYEGAATSSPADALDAAASEVGYIGDASDFHRERTDENRVLYTYRVEAEIKQAMIVVNGPTLDRGKAGWHAESWARCDLSEFPDSVIKAHRLDRWTDRNRERVPTYEISSGPGPEHCGWQTATFLKLNGRTYIGNPPDDLVPEYIADTYAHGVSVPAEAVDTGYIRDGSHLWLAADRKAAYIGSEDSAERWPVVIKEFWCA